MLFRFRLDTIVQSLGTIVVATVLPLLTYNFAHIVIWLSKRREEESLMVNR